MSSTPSASHVPADASAPSVSDTRQSADDRRNVATMPISALMSSPPITCGPDTELREAARLMRERDIASMVVLEGETAVGILTARSLLYLGVADNQPLDTPVRAVMLALDDHLSPDDLGSDALHRMLEMGVSHLPVIADGQVVGVVSQTDLTKFQALSTGGLVGEIVESSSPADIAKIVANLPDLLAQLVATGSSHEVTTRLTTDIADAATRRLLKLAEEELGAPPVPYLWLACGSQGRQEQTGVSDQDNCLILNNAVSKGDDAYFAKLAAFVSDGLARCGYFYCPGEMMATTAKWRQPLSVWRGYFDGWIDRPDPMARMLASVMFDLRPISGNAQLYDELVQPTLERASKNSIFVTHMIANSVGHKPPIGFFGGLSTIRSGEHRNTIDLKHNGVVPVVDLARIYAIKGRLAAVNTRSRLRSAIDAGVVSASGGGDLLDAYDLIAETRLTHQAVQIRNGYSPDNFLAPHTLSGLERKHLRDAFRIVRTMQSALGYGGATTL